MDMPVDKVEILPPTWLGILPVLLQAISADVYKNKGAEAAYIELKRMAEHADRYNEELKSRKSENI